MRKFISVLLSALMILSAVTISAAAAEESLVLTVANDLHFDLEDSSAETVKKNNSESVEYAHVSSGGQLLYESKAIIKAFLENAANNESDFVILPGDITNNGIVTEHEAFAEILREFEATSGKQVYVVPGNHDLFKTKVNEFESIYAEFGYDDAVANDPGSGSYIAPLSGDYMLLAIDSCKPAASPHGMTAERIDWIEAQVNAAKASGKKIIAMMHHNLLEHYILAATIHTGAVVTKDGNRLADVLADAGVKYILTAHSHNHNITSYTSANGNTIYEAVTNSLSQYACAYRVVSFGAKTVFKTEYVRKIDTSLLPGGIHADALALAESNFLMYAKNCTYLGVKNTIKSYTKAAQLKKILNTDNETINSIIDKAAAKIEESVSLPIYTEDAAQGEKSLEAMAQELGITLIKSEYNTLIDLVTRIYQAQAEGDENYASYSDEMILVSRLLAVAINYAFSDVTAEEFAAVLSYVASLFNVNISADILNAVGGAIGRFRGAELFVTSVAVPILAQFGNDQDLADKNITLPGYDEGEATQECLLDKIRNFFRKIFDFFYTIFAMIA